MKKASAVLLLLFYTSANATEVFNCNYAKSGFENGKVGQFTTPTPSKVEISEASIKVFRPDGSFLISPPLMQDKGAVMMADDGSKVYASAKDKTSFAVSDRVAKKTEQWDNCTVSIEEKLKAESVSEMSRVESMTSAQAKKYFLSEKHAFTTNCLVWDDVTMITGPSPAILMAGTVMMGSSQRWSGHEYSFKFNGGSMIARFTPSEKRHKFLIQAGEKFYGCGPSEIDKNF